MYNFFYLSPQGGPLLRMMHHTIELRIALQKMKDFRKLEKWRVAPPLI